jgi:hypothetical protein
MAYLGTKPANQVIDSALIADGTITPADLSTGKPVWDTSGNVGINTSNPSDRLSVNGSVRTFGAYNESTSDAGVFLGYSGASSPRIGFFNGTTAQNWQIDNFNGEFRWFTPGVVRMALDSSGNLKFNSGYGGVATAYGCRAWVNFNGAGTVSIRSSGNVSSISDNGVGDYTVNFTNAMPDANYSASAIAQRDVGGAANQCGLVFIPANGSTVRQTSSAFRIVTTDQAMNSQDSIVVSVSIFR